MRTSVTAILLVLSRLGFAEESTPEAIIRELAHVHLDEGLIADCSQGCQPPPLAPETQSPLMGPPAPALGQQPPPQAPLQGYQAPNMPISAPPTQDDGISSQYAQQPTRHLGEFAHPFNLPEHRQIKHQRPNCGPVHDGYTINFEDVSVMQLIQFISKISNTNYIFNNADLLGPDGRPLTITIVSEDQTSVEDLSAALLQVLKMNNLSVVEQGNNVLIYRDQKLSKVSTVVTDDNIEEACGNAIITRVFQLANVDANRMAALVKPLLSPEAIVEASPETRHLIVTDITGNVHKISDLLTALDTPNLAISVAQYQVQNADPSALAEYAREILNPLAQGSTLSITPEAASSTIFIVGTPFIIEKALSILNSLDVSGITSIIPVPPPIMELANNTFYMYKLKYQSGDDIADSLHQMGTNLQMTGVGNPEFINTIFSIQWVPVNNSIVITGTDESINKVVQLIDVLDTLPKQVYLEVLILDTTLENSLDFGVQWIALGQENGQLDFGSGLLSAVPPNPNLQGFADAAASTVPPGLPAPGNAAFPFPLATPLQLAGFSDIVNDVEAFSLGILGNIIRHNGKSFLTLGALISALDEEGDTTIVLNPKLMVEDGQPADFFVGENIPYQTTSTVIQQTGSVTQNIQYEDVGVGLQITPTIAPDNMVTLQINQSIANVVGVPGATNLTPVTTKILTTTRVHVPDGTFLVMSGHVSDVVQYVHSGIPCLGTLPCIGSLFGRTVEMRQKRNLILFIRPRVVTSACGGIKLTDEEGYQHNWDANPCSIFEGGPPTAPECQYCPPIPAEMKH